MITDKSGKSHSFLSLRAEALGFRLSQCLAPWYAERGRHKCDSELLAAFIIRLCELITFFFSFLRTQNNLHVNGSLRGVAGAQLVNLEGRQQQREGRCSGSPVKTVGGVGRSTNAHKTSTNTQKQDGCATHPENCITNWRKKGSGQSESDSRLWFNQSVPRRGHALFPLTAVAACDRTTERVGIPVLGRHTRTPTHPWDETSPLVSWPFLFCLAVGTAT